MITYLMVNLLISYTEINKRSEQTFPYIYISKTDLSSIKPSFSNLTFISSKRGITQQYLNNEFYGILINQTRRSLQIHSF
jgi:uncharacterized protein YlbG (UPF0298 family)